jgi:hypothetical protein
MMAHESKFISKFQITKWSFVNFELFESLELTKYIIWIFLFINIYGEENIGGK